MLPEKLSTDLTSLNYASDRQAMIVELIVGEEGALLRSDVYGALVRNQAKLAYNSVAAWLEGGGAIPPEIPAVPGLEDNLRLQDSVAQRLKALRHEHGALTLETVEARLVFDADELKDLQAEKKNRAKDIIEDLRQALR
jgi:exoribonuclease-2